MTEADDLDRCIDGLLRLQKVSWHLLANQSTTADESRAARSQLRKSSSDLRTLFEMRSQRDGFVRRGVADHGVRLWPAPAA